MSVCRLLPKAWFTLPLFLCSAGPAIAAELDFAALFAEAKQAPVGGTVLVQALPGDTLVLKQAVLILDGLGLYVEAPKMRLEGTNVIRAYADNDEAPAKAGVGPPVSSPPPRGQAGYSTNGEDGLEGYPGSMGEPGNEGRAASLVVLDVAELEGPGELEILNQGQRGGKGQTGGQGGQGGQGGKGGAARGGWPNCNGGGGDGGHGGPGGKAGQGGMGGSGGAAGKIVLYCPLSKSPAVKASAPGGEGGRGGDMGAPGPGGPGGSGGEGRGKCGGGSGKPTGPLGPQGSQSLPGPNGPNGEVLLISCHGG